jgi:hypothetical protein
MDQITGINIQIPWSRLLINGDKSVETRSYALPKKYEGIELALIETPGKYGRFKAQIIGTITFSHCFRYTNKELWIDDYNRHKVEELDELYSWNEEQEKWGWVVSQIHKFNHPLPAPKKKGIIFTHGCIISNKAA